MVWNKGWRERAWDNIDEPWDLIIIGGGITGAGVLRQAVQAGLKTLLFGSVVANLVQSSIVPVTVVP